MFIQNQNRDPQNRWGWGALPFHKTLKRLKYNLASRFPHNFYTKNNCKTFQLVTPLPTIDLQARGHFTPLISRNGPRHRHSTNSRRAIALKSSSKALTTPDATWTLVFWWKLVLYPTEHFCNIYIRLYRLNYFY